MRIPAFVCGMAAAVTLTLPLAAQQQRTAPPAAPARAVAIRAGRLVDPEAGTAAANQVILVQDGKITDVVKVVGKQPLDLFPWLLIAVLLLLAVEGLVANRFYRRVR